MDDRPLHRLEELRRRLGWYRADHAAGHEKSEGMNRITWIRTQHHVAGRGDRLGDVSKALLRAQRGDDLGLRIEFHAETPAVIGRLGLAQAGNSARCRVAVGPRLAQRFLQFFDDMGRRRQIRIAHAEIDDIGAGIACSRLGPVDLFEHVRRQTADAVKIFHRSWLRQPIRVESPTLCKRNRIRLRPEIAPNQGFGANSGAVSVSSP